MHPRSFMNLGGVLYHSKSTNFLCMIKQNEIIRFLLFPLFFCTCLPWIGYAQTNLTKTNSFLVPSVSVQVEWLNGTIWDSTQVAIDQTLYIGNEEPSDNNLNRNTLHQNYPNPFHTETHIPFFVSSPSYITITIYNALGQKITILYQGNKDAGDNHITWNGLDTQRNPVASGLYFYEMKIAQLTLIRKMLLIR